MQTHRGGEETSVLPLSQGEPMYSIYYIIYLSYLISVCSDLSNKNATMWLILYRAHDATCRIWPKTTSFHTRGKTFYLIIAR